MRVDWKEIVKGVAPVLGTALGGPFGGAAVKFLADKFLGNPTASEEEIATAVLGAGPEQLTKLREIDNAFKVKMKELDVDVFKLEVADREGARALAKVDMRPHIGLSAVYTIGYFAMLYMFMSGDVEIAANLQSEFNIVLGVMTAAQAQIMQFWFGSSSGSKAKDVRS
jgi:hypothetical protein